MKSHCFRENLKKVFFLNLMKKKLKIIVLYQVFFCFCCNFFNKHVNNFRYEISFLYKLALHSNKKKCPPKTSLYKKLLLSFIISRYLYKPLQKSGLYEFLTDFSSSQYMEEFEAKWEVITSTHKKIIIIIFLWCINSVYFCSVKFKKHKLRLLLCCCFI